MENLNLSKDDIASVFRLWIERYNECPEDFESYSESLESNDQYAECEADYFIELYGELKK